MNFVQNFDVVPQFWQFLGGLRSDDLIIELIQNELDANASHTSIEFHPDRLVCQGDGEPISEDGWDRLTYVMGAGDQVESKQFSIGVKNHGLKACFGLGNKIVLRSDGPQDCSGLSIKMVPDMPPSPGTLPEPILDEEAPSVGCSVEVPYRHDELVITKGEHLTLNAVDEGVIERLFRSACKQLPERLLGIIRPDVRGNYTLSLSHYKIGSVKIHWRAKRGRPVGGGGRRRFTLFRRECEVLSDIPDIPAETVYEQACIFRIPFSSGPRRQIPNFYAWKDKRHFAGEIAWCTNKWGKPEATRGSRRYPIGYSPTSESALTGIGVHFSAPYISDSERHGISEQELNDSIDDSCKDALVDIMASYLLHRHGGESHGTLHGRPCKS